MNKCLSLVHLITITLLPLHMASGQTELPQARIVNLSIDPAQVVVLHVRPGYVSSVRVLEAVSSVVLGDPGAFKAEHSEAEPQLVFFKATSAKPAQTNALIMTRGGREISLSLVSQGKSDHSEVVDYVLNCERPHSFLITSARPSFVVGETKNTPEGPSAVAPEEKPSSQAQQLLKAQQLENPHWEGKALRVAVGQTTEKEEQMAVTFAILNASARTDRGATAADTACRDIERQTSEGDQGRASGDQRLLDDNTQTRTWRQGRWSGCVRTAKFQGIQRTIAAGSCTSGRGETVQP